MTAPVTPLLGSSADKIVDEFEPILAASMREWQVPGLALCIVQSGSPAVLRTYGFRDVEASLPVLPETPFNLASVTKSFTALGLCLLADDGLLEWQKPVREYIPEFRLHDAVAGDRVRVQDLLTHTSGLPRHDEVWMAGNRSREDMLAALRHLEPSRDFRTGFQYCNLGYMVAGMVAERVSGRSWEAFTRERILLPLRMNDATCSHEGLSEAGAAQPYVLPDEGTSCCVRERVRERAPVLPIGDAPAGAINASIRDMANYLRLYVEDGRFDGRQIVSSGRLRAMRAPHVFNGSGGYEEFEDSHYGLGLGVNRYRGEVVVNHGGGWIGWSTWLGFLPRHGVGIAVLTNVSPNPGLMVATWGLVDRLLGKEQVNWAERCRSAAREADAAAGAERALSSRTASGKPKRPMSAYAGDFDHPGYGRITIAADGDHLTWCFGDRTGPLAYNHHETFVTPVDRLVPDRPISAMPITFAYDRAGDVDRLSAPLEPAVADIVFVRAEDTRHD